VQDPGNLGTILRSAEAFGASAILCLPGTVHVWNAKAVRASAGSVFRMPSVAIDAESLALVRSHGIRLVGTTASRGTPLHAFDFKQPCAVLIGNEGSGIADNLLAIVDQTITVPQKSNVESINAAVAASIICYEAGRQRGI
jgi:TrmH family RNA methyltransferase